MSSDQVRGYSGRIVGKPDNSVAFLLPGEMCSFQPAPRTSDIWPEYRDAAWLGAIVASESESQALKLHRFIQNYQGLKSARKCVVFRSFPVLVEDFKYQDKIPTVKKQIVLSGASALRVRVKLAKRLDGDEVEADLGRQRQADSADLLRCRIVLKPSELNLPFLVECRNLFNFYHFTTESLIYLQMYRDYELTGPIWLVTSSKRETKSFIQKSIRTLYPDLADRVEIKSGSLSVPRAIIPFNTNHLYHQTTNDQFPDIERRAEFAKIKAAGTLRPATVKNLKFIYNNSRDEYIDRHREVVLSGLVRGAPRRLYVGRKLGEGRDRALLGEDETTAMLARFGFEHIYLEDYSPREQAQLCYDAVILISAHGAGFANMMYAHAGAWFIELSHLQTARHRFGDFNMHASVSGARYLHFFADHAIENEDVPSMGKDGHAGIAMSAAAIHRLEGLIGIISDVREYRRTIRAMNRALKDRNPEQVFALIAEKPFYRHGCPSICAMAADAALLDGDRQGAMQHLVQALKIAPYRADLWQRRNEVALSLGHHKEVQENIRRMSLYHPFRWMHWIRDSSGATIIQEPTSD